MLETVPITYEFCLRNSVTQINVGLLMYGSEGAISDPIRIWQLRWVLLSSVIYFQALDLQYINHMEL